MNRYSLIILCLLCYTAQAQTPNWNEWFRQKKTQLKYLSEQIAALKVYLEYLKKGYDVAKKGLSTIELIKSGSFGLHKEYFSSLKQVSSVVKNSPKVDDAILMQERIILDFKILLQDIRGDPNLGSDEIAYIEMVYKQMLITGNASMDELSMITTNGEAEMKDDERLLRLDKVYDDMLDQYSFTQDFITSVHMISLWRAKEKSQLKDTQELISQ